MVIKKKSWQMTQKAYIAEDEAAAKQGYAGHPGLMPDFAQRRSGTIAGHRQLVEDALAEGKPVSPEVLKDYPDLAREVRVELTPAKEPWQMTYQEYVNNLGDYATNIAEKKQLPIMYKNELVRAIKSGKPVPPEVLKDYPELNKENWYPHYPGEYDTEKEAKKVASKFTHNISNNLKISDGKFRVMHRANGKWGLERNQAAEDWLKAKSQSPAEAMAETRKRGLLNSKFTGTRGEIEAMDNPQLFKKRYIDNIEANIESLKDKGIDTSRQTLYNSSHTFDQELKTAKRMTVQQWEDYIAVFRSSSMANIPQVSDWEAKAEPEKIIPKVLFELERKESSHGKLALPGIPPDKDISYKNYQSVKQTQRGVRQDLRQLNKIVIEPGSPRTKRWLREPGSMDIKGIDTPSWKSPHISPRTPRITPKTPRLR